MYLKNIYSQQNPAESIGNTFFMDYRDSIM